LNIRGKLRAPLAFSNPLPSAEFSPPSETGASMLAGKLFNRLSLPNTLIAATLLCFGVASSEPIIHVAHADIADLEESAVPVSSAKQQRTLKLINYLIDKSHYRAVDLDDDFSTQVLTAYLEQLDPTKSFFLQTDIDQFSRLKYEFDDFIRDGTLKPAFAIFSIFRTRVEQRIEYALGRLNQDFDFTLVEEYQIDREDANWAQNVDELNDLWRKRIKNDILGLRFAEKEDGEIRKTLNRRYTHIARRTRQFKSEDVFQTFVNAYATSIEPHTSYFSPRASENFKINMRLSLEGIGAVLQTDNEYTLVRRIVPGGPADLGGQLQAEDRIVGVGQGTSEIVDVIGWRLDDVVDLIRGPKASTVRLEILPGESGLEADTKIIEIVRDEIRLEEQAARKKVLEVVASNGKAKIGLIDLPSFSVDFDGMHSGDPDYKSTTRDVRKLLIEFQSENIDGLVIDLRGNGGGALTEAIALTGLFIPQGPVVQVENSGGNIQIDRDPDPEIVYDGPLVVLVDGYSASASEIFAGAIQDYGRGLIIGEPTFGKGTVQNLVNLNRFARNDGNLGQLKVTIAQFFRINGDSTQFRGVTPDLIWPTSDPESEIGERSYDNAIPWRKISQAKFDPYSMGFSEDIIDRARKEHEERIRNNPEFSYFMDVSEINKERREIKSVSLNEKMRRQERKVRDTERLELENRKRKALGKSIFADIESLEEFERKEQEGAEVDRKPDAFVLESARILGDFIYFADVTRGTESNLVERTKPAQILNN
jgi:carboxyl-terminal processing protease